MLKRSGNDIRTTFLQYFKDTHGHHIRPSASLIPANPTVLLTPAGMLPFVPIFLGIEPPPKVPRVASSQKCARVSGKASDLEFVGRTLRHHTFFEMLGNFSFGDYSKKEAIAWSWDFITNVLELPKERLWVSVFEEDKEARQIWENDMGLPSDRVWDMGAKDNFWGPPGPTGPCGPCSEIHYDLGDHIKDDDARYLEIWNLVFMELFKDADGNTAPLEHKNIDTGMGLERIAMVVQGVHNTFETDLLFPILKKLAELTNHHYKKDDATDVALKIVTDHIRCVAFAIGDGIIPSNEGRGYVIRMILRRAIRYGKQLGIQEPLLFKLVSTIRDIYQDTYPELKDNYTHIVDTVKAEEKRFLDTLERGTKLLDEVIAETKTQKKAQVDGESAFKLYDTYGFPIELTQEIAEENGLTVDLKGFEAAMDNQRERARSSQGDKTIVADQLFADIIAAHGDTEFLGYDTLESEGSIVALIHNGQQVDSFGGTNEPFQLILDRTPFYAESGGQVGDKGILYVNGGQQAQTIVVKDTKKVGNLFLHECLFDQGGSIKVGESVQAEVHPDTRSRTAAHHSATHLLHSALKHILGEHVSQAGSYVGPDGARFDFTFPRGVTHDELQQIEMLVNRWIQENTERDVAITDIETAKAQGAVAMFDEKYSDHVRVITFGPESKELCGGTHVNRLGDIGLFKITSESAIAAGIRRVEYVVGNLALHAMLTMESRLQELSDTLKTPVPELTDRAKRLLDERKDYEKQIKALSEQLALGQIHEFIAKKPEDTPFLTAQPTVDGADTLKYIADTLKEQLPEDVIFLGSNVNGKALFIAHVPDAWVNKGIKAGDLVKKAASLCSGGGGGKPTFAQAGGKDGSKVGDALAEIEAILQKSPQTTSG